MTTYTAISKNVTTMTPVNKLAGQLVFAGSPIGLLLSLTYATLSGLTTYTPESKNTTAYSTINKN